jgi:hypothetical protein
VAGFEPPGDTDLPRRLFIYHYRIFDKYGVSPITLAILGDTNRKWRPTSYHYQSLGCGITFHFRICKTIDFKGNLDDPRYCHQQTLFIIAGTPRNSALTASNSSSNSTTRDTPHRKSPN